jgi:hypothetical protein
MILGSVDLCTPNLLLWIAAVTWTNSGHSIPSLFALRVHEVARAAPRMRNRDCERPIRW